MFGRRAAPGSGSSLPRTPPGQSFQSGPSLATFTRDPLRLTAETVTSSEDTFRTDSQAKEAWPDSLTGAQTSPVPAPDSEINRPLLALAGLSGSQLLSVTATHAAETRAADLQRILLSADGSSQVPATLQRRCNA